MKIVSFCNPELENWSGNKNGGIAKVGYLEK